MRMPKNASNNGWSIFDVCGHAKKKNHHEILNDKQFGFRSKHSTYMAIAQLVDKVTNAVEKKMKQQLAYS